MIWVVLAGMTAVALGATAWPLLRPPRPVERPDTGLAVYRAQLAEVDRDVAAGRLAEADAQAARAELGRRLLSEDREVATTVSSSTPRRMGAAALVLLACIGAGALYGAIGSPTLPDAPLSARQAAPQGIEFASALAKIEARVASHPDDLAAWNVVAPLYLRLRRNDDAVRAYANVLRIGGVTPDRLTNYAEAQIYAAGGTVTADARKDLERAVAIDGSHVKARYYLGLAAQQDGDTERARTVWSKLAEEAGPDSPLAKGLAARIATLDRAAVAADVAALPADAQGAAIRGMVERLAGRLQENGNDLEGWLRLVRAYRVLNEAEKARAALGDARRTFATDANARAQLDTLARELGLEG